MLALLFLARPGIPPCLQDFEVEPLAMCVVLSSALSVNAALIRRGINKVKSESCVIETIISSLKEIYTTSGELEGTDTIIEALDTEELDEIMLSVDSVIETAVPCTRAMSKSPG